MDKSFLLLFFKKEDLPSFFPFVLLAYLIPLLLTLSLVTPPWQNADEPFHMLRAVQVAHGGLLGWRLPGEKDGYGITGGLSDPAIYEATAPLWPVAMHPQRRVTLAALAESGAVGWHAHISYAVFQNTVQYGPVFYVPGAAAYWVGRAAGWSVDHTLTLARVCNALLFAGVATLALCTARRARLPLAALLLLPPSLSLAASASQDSLLLCGTALAVAVLDRAVEAGRRLSRGETWWLAALLACIGMARPPYIGFLLALCLATPRPQRPPLAPMLAAAGLVLAWCAAVALRVTVRMNGADARQQILHLAADPMHGLAILGNTARAYGLDYAEQFVGVFGWIDTRLPGWFMLATCPVLVLAAFAGTEGAARRPWLPLLGASVAIAGIFILQFLTFTPPGWNVVFGVLGRYFLPVAMILGLALPRTRLRVRSVAWCGVAAQAALSPALMLHAIVTRYYLLP